MSFEIPTSSPRDPSDHSPTEELRRALLDPEAAPTTPIEAWGLDIVADKLSTPDDLEGLAQETRQAGRPGAMELQEFFVAKIGDDGKAVEGNISLIYPGGSESNLPAAAVVYGLPPRELKRLQALLPDVPLLGPDRQRIDPEKKRRAELVGKLGHGAVGSARRMNEIVEEGIAALREQGIPDQPRERQPRQPYSARAEEQYRRRRAERRAAQQPQTPESTPTTIDLGHGPVEVKGVEEVIEHLPEGRTDEHGNVIRRIVRGPHITFPKGWPGNQS